MTNILLLNTFSKINFITEEAKCYCMIYNVGNEWMQYPQCYQKII